MQFLHRWNSARPGEVWYVKYRKNILETTGFRNLDGLHEVYEANGGQRYFKRLEADGARGNLSVLNPLVVSAMRR